MVHLPKNLVHVDELLFLNAGNVWYSLPSVNFRKDIAIQDLMLANTECITWQGPCNSTFKSYRNFEISTINIKSHNYL